MRKKKQLKVKYAFLLIYLNEGIYLTSVVIFEAGGLA